MTRQHTIIILALLGLTSVMLAYADPLFTGQTLFSPDASPFFPTAFQQYMLVSFWGNWGQPLLGIGSGGVPFHPLAALAFVLPPLAYHLASYICSTILLLFAGFFFLRGRRVPLLPAFLGGMAIAFAGYGFTLISAGHRGIFNMMPYAVLVLGFLDRGIERRSLFFFGLAGAFAGFGLIAQPDVMGLFLMLTAAYGIFRLARVMLAGTERRGALAVRTLAGGLIAAIFLGAVCFGWVQKLTTTIIPTREHQMEATGAKTPAEKWIFATNWSMPPEEIIEFIAPGIFGFETGDPAGPYWGRVGRTHKWSEHRQGLVNLKQHTIYLGVLQLLFAAYAVAAALGSRKSGSPYSGPGARKKHKNQKSNTANQRPKDDRRTTETAELGFGRADVWFWTGAAFLSILLALGRYFPLFRVFHALPLASQVRAPIKFIHITELAVAILFAFGLTLFLRHLAMPSNGDGHESGRVRRMFTGFAVAAGALGMLMLVATGMLPSFKSVLMEYWRQLGLGQFTALLMERMHTALVHGGILFLIGAGVFAVARALADKKLAKQIAICALVVAIPADLIIVARHYVRVRDVSMVYADNPIAERIQNAPQRARTAYYLSPRTKLDFLWRNFNHHRVYMMNPGPTTRLSPEYKAFFEAFGDNVLRLWQVTNTGFILGPHERLQGLIQHPAIEVDTRFTIVNGRLQVTPNAAGPYALLRFKTHLPRALLYHEWEQLEPEAALARMTSQEWNPYQSVLVSDSVSLSAPGGQPTAVNVLRHERTKVEIEMDAPKAGLLLLNDKYDPDWNVFLDGKRVPLLRCNYLMRGVEIPAGRHRVVFTYRPWVLPFVLSLSACALLIGWGAVRRIRSRHNE